ncbi:DUF2254 domain-containing protein [Planococcus salinus]|uniref:DUF2254 domain-containing protein n=1 Tax=Planococcus salinus TaxID=1848460 RepID=A0A3M8P7M6_9BACL|nr:DUF2254 domain-containing protein [Planococcus salinus]RNF39431.1 DUF2254 domain-containing protein [Planococcus salinus]
MEKITYWFKEKFWVTPAVYSLLAVALSVIFFYVDLLVVERYREYIPSILLTNVDLAKTIMGALAGALLTMTTFTFSTILVVLTMYSSQFSPRTLKNFVHDRLTWRVLGIFLGGFVYNTLSLLFMRDDLYSHNVISTFVGILIAFFCLSAFAYFVHHIASTIQVSKLIIGLVEDAERVISLYEKLEDEQAGNPGQWAPVGIKEAVRAETSGYVQFISFDKMKDFSLEHEAKIELHVKTGDFVYEGKPLATIYLKKSSGKDLSEFWVIGQERTTEQDVDFALQKLVEVGLRAISPGINDPNTANEILARIGRLLGRLGCLELGPQHIENKEGEKVILYPFFSYKEILYHVYYQVSHYGKEDISVLAAVTESLGIAAAMGDSRHHEALWNMELYVLEGLEAQQLKTLDRDFLQKKIDELADAVNKRPVNLHTLEGD